jgi:hypothetical protein
VVGLWEALTLGAAVAVPFRWQVAAPTASAQPTAPHIALRAPLAGRTLWPFMRANPRIIPAVGLRTNGGTRLLHARHACLPPIHQDNDICTLKGSLATLKFITHLDLSNNNLRDLPKLLRCLGRLQNLQHLSLQVGASACAWRHL